MVETNDGFRIAEADLQLRGPGEFFGTRQSGLPEFRVARLPQDQELLERARLIADDLMRYDPMLAEPQHALLRDAVIDRFGPENDPIPA
jgi:ATP-dependent DNA helicase RecG